MSHTTGHVSHWEDLETRLSIATNSLLPKAAETLKHQTQDQLDDNITSLMAQDPSHSYNHKELAKITGSLSHTLIATLKLSDKHAAQRQQELTRAQRRIEQLELETQERLEESDEAEQGTEEEINQLKETLAATSQELERSRQTAMIGPKSYSMLNCFWKKQRPTSEIKMSESKPLKLTWMSHETRLVV